MFLTNISPLSHIISNSACDRAHATKFGWMLYYNAVNVFAKFHIQILSRGRITIGQVRELQYYVLDQYFLSFKHNSNSTYFRAHATKFGWVLDYNVLNAYAKFHSRILSRG